MLSSRCRGAGEDRCTRGAGEVQRCRGTEVEMLSLEVLRFSRSAGAIAGAGASASAPSAKCK